MAYKERLQLVRDAIDEILLTGQSVAYEGRRLDMANLEDLRRLEAEYEKRAAAEAGRGRNRLIYPVPRDA